jgi:hypothetical protein
MLTWITTEIKTQNEQMPIEDIWTPNTNVRAQSYTSVIGSIMVASAHWSACFWLFRVVLTREVKHVLRDFSSPAYLPLPVGRGPGNQPIAVIVIILNPSFTWYHLGSSNKYGCWASPPEMIL